MIKHMEGMFQTTYQAHRHKEEQILFSMIGLIIQMAI